MLPSPLPAARCPLPSGADARSPSAFQSKRFNTRTAATLTPATSSTALTAWMKEVAPGMPPIAA
ncbi:hypothetical protein ACFU6M_10385 [Streptomyces bottropensis]|uniref:hypothetical protein n=1 Tax=Streptomyces bottropensis TaxID=42235 RepID=UPI00367D16B8